MPIDTSIYSQLRPIQIDSPLEAQAKVDQFRVGQMQNRLAELALGSKQREIEEGNALRGLMADPGNFDASGNMKRTALPKIGAVAPGQYGTYQKQLNEQEKAARDNQKAQIAAAREQIELIGQVAGAATDPQSYAAGLQMLQQAGVDISQIPTEYNPQYVAQARLQALDAAKQLDQVWKQKQFDLDGQKFTYQKENDAQNRQVTIRGQNMTDARGREANDLKRQEVAAGGKPPAGYRWKADGALEPIPGGPAEKDSTGTEGEKNAAGYGLRMAEAEKIIGTVTAADPKAQKPGFIEQVTGGNGVIANKSRSPERQQYRQAQEDWVRAKLRKESGAVIGEEEMNKEISTYFPQIGDSEAVIRQKADARRVAMDAMKQAAGKAGRNITAPSGGSSNIDALLKKYGG